MQTVNSLQSWYTSQPRYVHGILLGVAVGVTGGLLGLLLALAGPIVAVGLVLGGLAALYILTDLSAALYGMIAVIVLIPFGTLPVRIGLTPTLLDAAMGAFILVYLFQWMTGKRQQFRITPVHGLVALYASWLILAFALGLRHAPPTSTIARQFAETLLSISLVFILVDVVRDIPTLRRLLLVVIVLAAGQALITLGLYILPDDLAERTLVRLARIGYPNGGVIRYIEDNPVLAERAIGTWVDPNALGGLLAVATTFIGSQVFARNPLLPRWLIIPTFGLTLLALFLTFSRASILAAAAGLFIIGMVRYRRYLPVLIVGGLLLLLLPQTQIFVERFIQAFTAQDLATQMRIGEYTDSLRLISRYPIFGVGFTGTPDNDIYTDAASMYLIMANQIGLVGVGIFLTLMAGLFFYGWRAWPHARHLPDIDAIHLGLHAALLTLLVNAVADLYFFRLDFHASISLLWLLVALCLAASQLALAHRQTDESSVVKTDFIR